MLSWFKRLVTPDEPFDREDLWTFCIAIAAVSVLLLAAFHS